MRLALIICTETVNIDIQIAFAYIKRESFECEGHSVVHHYTDHVQCVVRRQGLVIMQCLCNVRSGERTYSLHCWGPFLGRAIPAVKRDRICSFPQKAQTRGTVFRVLPLRGWAWSPADGAEKLKGATSRR